MIFRHDLDNGRVTDMILAIISPFRLLENDRPYFDAPARPAMKCPIALNDCDICFGLFSIQIVRLYERFLAYRDILPYFTDL